MYSKLAITSFLRNLGNIDLGCCYLSIGTYTSQHNSTLGFTNGLKSQLSTVKRFLSQISVFYIKSEINLKFEIHKRFPTEFSHRLFFKDYKWIDNDLCFLSFSLEIYFTNGLNSQVLDFLSQISVFYIKSKINLKFEIHKRSPTEFSLRLFSKIKDEWLVISKLFSRNLLYCQFVINFWNTYHSQFSDILVLYVFLAQFCLC